jgi:DNA-binding transcriptional LysR family regulator
VKLSLRQLQIFCAIARSGSTSAAAGSVALSQSATSAALGELEDTLGEQLFDRVGKRLMLNDSGRALLPAALALLEAAQEIENSFAADGRVADLRLAASTTIGNYVLPPLLAAFRRQVPQARLQLRIGNTLEVVDAVGNFEVDLGFIEGPCHAPDIMVVPWRDDELVIVAAPGHPLARQAKAAKLTLKQLRAARWLLREPGSGTRETVEHSLLPHLDHLEADMALGSSEAIKNAAAEGIGLSCLSRYVVQDLVAARRLVVLPTVLPALKRRLTVIHHRKKPLSPALLRFAGECGARIGRSARSVGSL